MLQSEKMEFTSKNPDGRLGHTTGGIMEGTEGEYRTDMIIASSIIERNQRKIVSTSSWIEEREIETAA